MSNLFYKLQLLVISFGVGLVCSESQQRLVQLEDSAKSSGLGKWGTEGISQHIRDIKWSVEDPRKLVDSKHSKPIKGSVCGQIFSCNIHVQ